MTAPSSRQDEPCVGLVGAIAEALASRLELSGYRPVPLRDPAMPAEAPELVVLSPDREDWIPGLRERWGSLPLLLGIEEDTVEGRCRCLASGADDFWLTGLGPSDLLTRLRLHRRQRQQAAVLPETLQVADLTLTPQLHRVERGSRRLALTAREYELLLLLMRHRGTVVSRERILREIWEDQPRAASNVIEVYVRYLRRKLEESGESRLIHTVRGQGYCLSALPPPRDGGAEASGER
ncbi:MAG: winged-helix domain-containing protein [Synechococcaceae cyanobacterium]|nr:winged-helix domain-containing protein [Synechococcaceae cyanobacterium]